MVNLLMEIVNKVASLKLGVKKLATMVENLACYMAEKWKIDLGILEEVCPVGRVDVIERIRALPVGQRSYPEVLGGRVRKFESSPSEGKEESSSSMSSEIGKVRKLSARDMVERAKKRKVSSASLTGSDQPVPISVAFDAPSSRTRAGQVARQGSSSVRIPTPSVKLALKNIGKTPASVRSSDELVATFPRNFGEDGKMALSCLGHMLFPHAEKHLNKRGPSVFCGDLSASLFQCLQASLFTGRAIDAAEEDKKSLDDKVKAADARAANSATKLEVANRRTKEALSEVASMRLELEAVKGENVRLREKLSAKKEQLQDLCGYYSWLARVECMEEYARGEHTAWDAVAERASLDEVYKGRLGLVNSDCEEDRVEEVGQGDECFPEVGAVGGVSQMSQAVEPVDGVPVVEAQAEERAGT